jgi:hypothetical protein
MDANVGNLTVSAVAEKAHGRLRSIQHWADQGILRATSGTTASGRGVHRTFTLTEARVAAVASALGPFAMSTPTLRAVCDFVRPLCDTPPQAPDPAFGQAVMALLSGEPFFVVIAPDGNGGVNLASITPTLSRVEIPMENLFEVYGPFVGLVDLGSIIRRVS